MILHGDSLEKLKEFPDNYFDSVVTDPPYGLSFMGKKWDYDVPSVALWVETFRVLKPGGHLLGFGGTRTYHRLVVNIEDAGFEIRDQVMWIYGSGFPKSLDVSKAIDKAAGAEREVIHTKTKSDIRGSTVNGEWQGLHKPDKGLIQVPYTAPATDDAKTWSGWGTALKPANEPIVLARKPLSESTVAKNVLRWGTGALNVDASRIKCLPGEKPSGSGNGQTGTVALSGDRNDLVGGSHTPEAGRWPANVLFDERAAEMLDAQSGTLSKPGNKAGKLTKRSVGNNVKFNAEADFVDGSKFQFGDSGGASRFFYCAKSSKSERNAGLEGMPAVRSGSLGTGEGGGPMLTGSGNERKGMNQNHHPTVKPIKLMEYLIRLITPPSGCVLDPFAGSGSTGVAAKGLGFGFVGVEMSAEYAEIARKRLEAASGEAACE